MFVPFHDSLPLQLVYEGRAWNPRRISFHRKRVEWRFWGLDRVWHLVHGRSGRVGRVALVSLQTLEESSTYA